MELFLAPAAAFLAVTLLVLALLPGRRLDVDGRVATFTGVSTRRQEMGQPFMRRRVVPVLESIGRRASRLASVQARSQMRELLDQAGNPISIEVLLALRAGAAILLPGGYLLLLNSGHWSTTQVLLALVLGGLGSYAPKYWLSHVASTRQQAIQRSLPDALDLVVVSMEAGLALDSAFGKVVEKAHGPLADELRRMLREMQLGKSRRDALRDMATRCGVKDLTNLVNGIIQADQMGVSMAELMRTQADEDRVIRRQSAEERAHQASVKMVIPLILFILPSVLIVAIGPAALTVYHTIIAGAALK